MNRLIQWFVEHPIAANLCMVLIVLGGLFSLPKLDKEVFPSIALGRILITVPYPGAGPLDVERQIVVRLEEAISSLTGIERIQSEAREGVGTVTVEVAKGQPVADLLNDIKTRVDAIPSLPIDAERPQVQELMARREVMSLALFGDLPEQELKREGRLLREALNQLPSVSLVELRATRAEEISIQLTRDALLAHQLTFDEVVKAIRASSLDMPAGVLRTANGTIQVQTRGLGSQAADYAALVLRALPSGGVLRLGDVATIEDGFEAKSQRAHFNGKPAIFLDVFVTDNPDILAATQAVKAYMASPSHRLSPALSLAIARDWSVLFEGRMNLLLSNALMGLCLVFVVLMLFLQLRLALWVSSGIAVAFLGALWWLPATGVSVNMVSMFAMILVLGILVDDAIIVGESIYASHQRGMQGAACAASGAKAVSKPVLFAVVSTMIFFAPMLLLPGVMGDMTKPIPVVVLLCLFFSLFESLFILPAHLRHIPVAPKTRSPWMQKLEDGRRFFADGLEFFAANRFRRWVEASVRHSLITALVFMSAFVISVLLVVFGFIRGSFMPTVPSEFLNLTIELPEGVAFERTEALMQRVEAATERLKTDPEIMRANANQPFIESLQVWASENVLRATLALKPPEVREVGAQAVTRAWRDAIGDIPDAEKFSLAFTINQVGEAISLRLSVASDDAAVIERALADVKGALSRYPGIYDVADTYQTARNDIELDLHASAESQGFSLQSVARQVRQAIYGEEVQRIAREGEDVRVMARYPEAARTSLEDLASVPVSSQTGQVARLDQVADMAFVPGYTRIQREDRQRLFTITAELKKSAAVSANQIVADLMTFQKPEWQQRYPGFQLSLGGNMESESEFKRDTLLYFILALVLIYGLFAVAFNSYVLPALVLLAVPFGFMGAVFGHLLLGFEISMMSILGFLACAGVVVNDNLVLLDRVVQLRQAGASAWRAATQAASDRFRAIILTSLTTFVGLAPMLLEESTQARFLIPMAVSLAFGVLFATGVTLLLVPSLYYGASRLKHYLGIGNPVPVA